jgi:outer membrane lipoprotein-sorting protein
MEAQTAETLLQKMDELMSAPQDKQAVVKIVLTNKSGKEKIREASLKEKGRFKKLYRYTKPEKQAGISTLSLPEDKMWLYMPAFGNPIKITLLSKSQTFTGTDFSYEDMSGRSYSERYTPKLVESNDSKTHLLELVPKSKKSKYSKIFLYLDKIQYYPVKLEYFNKNNIFSKVATYEYAKKGKYWYAKEVLMVDVKKDHSTAIFMSDVIFDQGIDDKEFLVENLKQ